SPSRARAPPGAAAGRPPASPATSPASAPPATAAWVATRASAASTCRSAAAAPRTERPATTEPGGAMASAAPSASAWAPPATRPAPAATDEPNAGCSRSLGVRARELGDVAHAPVEDRLDHGVVLAGLLRLVGQRGRLHEAAHEALERVVRALELRRVVDRPGGTRLAAQPAVHAL